MKFFVCKIWSHDLTMIFAPQKNLTKLVLPLLRLLLVVLVLPDSVVVDLQNLLIVCYIDLFVLLIMCLLPKNKYTLITITILTVQTSQQFSYSNDVFYTDGWLGYPMMHSFGVLVFLFFLFAVVVVVSCCILFQQINQRYNQILVYRIFN